MNVLSTPNNFIPQVRIITPILDSKTLTGKRILFEPYLYDEDDDLIAVWNFGDLTTSTFTNCLSGNYCNTSYSYSSNGVKVISLTAKESTRGNEFTNYTRILIYNEGINLFPIIKRPKFKEIFNQTLTAYFNANESYVSICRLNCECSDTNPCETQVKSCYNVENLFCYNLDNQIGIPNKDYYLFFDWNFSETNEVFGNWTSDYSRVVEFNRTFFTKGLKYAELKIGYKKLNNILWSNKSITFFDFIDVNPECRKSPSGSSSFWVKWDDVNQKEILIDSTIKDPILNPSGCYNDKGWPSKSCCPSSMGSCNFSTFTCTGPPLPNDCSGYTTKETCEAFDYEVANKTIIMQTGKDNICNSRIIYNETCWYPVGNCSCIWDNEKNLCSGEYTQFDYTCGNEEIPTLLGSCKILTVNKINQCDTTNFMIYEQNATWTGSSPAPDYCKSGKKVFPCEGSVKLSFFTFINFIITFFCIRVNIQCIIGYI